MSSSMLGMSIRLAALVALAVSALAALIACTSSSDPSPTSPTDAGIVADADSASSVAGNPGSSSPGGTVRIAASNLLIPDPAVDDPPLGFSDSYDLHREIYSGLTRVVNEPSDPFQPELAARWDVADSQTSYAFTLCRGLAFSDGSPLVAADFKWSWERALKIGSTKAAQALGNIRGAAGVMDGSATQLSGVSAVDDLTLSVELVNADPYFPAKTASAAAMVLSRSNVERWHTDWAQWARTQEVRSPTSETVLPVGTGPFRLAEFEFGETYVLERNDHYHRGAVALDSVVFEVGDRTPRGLDGFDVGAVDIVLVYQQELEERPAIVAAGEVVATKSAPRLEYLAFNPDLAPYDDLNFRLALGAAIAPGRSLRLDEPGARVADTDQRVQNATDALADSTYAGRTSGITLTFHEYLQGLQLRQFEDAASAWQRELGVDTRYAPVSKSEYDDLFADGRIEFRFGRVSPNYPAPASVIDHCVDLFPNADGGSTSAELRRTAIGASATVDQVEREARFAELARHMVDEALVVPIHWATGDALRLVREGITGFDDPAYGGSRFEGVSLEPN